MDLARGVEWASDPAFGDENILNEPPHPASTRWGEEMVRGNFFGQSFPIFIDQLFLFYIF